MKKEPPKRGPGRPATGTAPKRYFRMEDDSWEMVQKGAEAGRETVSAFIRDTMLKAAKRRLKAE
jgi:uncharacterized protein (DUF1778 family)